MKVALVGGTGPFGRALAVRLVEAGDEVTIGSRDAARASEVADDLGANGASNADAVRGVDLVVLAMSADAALDTIAGLHPDAPLLSVASRLVFAAKRAHPAADPLSLAEHIAAAADVPVAAGLHSLAAGKLVAGRPDEDALVCGDDPAAKALGLELASHVVAGRALDAGPLSCSRALEGMTAVIVNANRRYKAHAGLRLTGLQ